MELKDTVKLMNSSDYQDRFKAEYFQLTNRIKGLSTMTDKYARGTLNFTPKCDLKLLDNQLRVMLDYRNHLIERAKIEGIDLNEYVEESTVDKTNNILEGEDE